MTADLQTLAIQTIALREAGSDWKTICQKLNQPHSFILRVRPVMKTIKADSVRPSYDRGAMESPYAPEPTVTVPVWGTWEDAFRGYAMDACNWTGSPLVDGNFSCPIRFRNQLVKRGLVTVFRDEGDLWMSFTTEGEKLASAMGIDLGLCREQAK